jgi:hypothetical protein
MALWTAKNTGILFGGVTDEDTGEETLESVFWNDLNGYQLAGKGKWFSLQLKRPKTKSKAAGKKKSQVPTYRPEDQGDSDEDEYVEVTLYTSTDLYIQLLTDVQSAVAATPQPLPVADVDPDDPLLSTPLPRFNAMLSILRNTLYMLVYSKRKPFQALTTTYLHSYGGIYERGKREYTLDDFYSIQLDKMDRYTCLKESGIVIAEEDESSSSEDDDSDEDDTEGEEREDDGEEEDMNHEDDIPAVAEEDPSVPLDRLIEPTEDEQVSSAMLF